MVLEINADAPCNKELGYLVTEPEKDTGLARTDWKKTFWK